MSSNLRWGEGPRPARPVVSQATRLAAAALIGPVGRIGVQRRGERGRAPAGGWLAVPRVGWGHVERGGGPGPPVAALPLALARVGARAVVRRGAIHVRLALHAHEREPLDAMFPAPHLSAQRPP